MQFPMFYFLETILINGQPGHLVKSKYCQLLEDDFVLFMYPWERASYKKDAYLAM